MSTLAWIPSTPDPETASLVSCSQFEPFLRRSSCELWLVFKGSSSFILMMSHIKSHWFLLPVPATFPLSSCQSISALRLVPHQCIDWLWWGSLKYCSLALGLHLVHQRSGLLGHRMNFEVSRSRPFHQHPSSWFYPYCQTFRWVVLPLWMEIAQSRNKTLKSMDRMSKKVINRSLKESGSGISIFLECSNNTTV